MISCKACWDKGLVMAGAYTNRDAGEGPPGGMLDVGSLRRSPAQAPERGLYSGSSTRVTEHKVFQRKQVPGGSDNFFFLTHQYLTLMKIAEQSQSFQDVFHH